MSRLKFELNKWGVRTILKSEGVAAECRKHAEATLSTASSSAEGYTMAEHRYPERVGYSVYAEDYPAIADNLKNNTLLKSLR